MKNPIVSVSIVHSVSFKNTRILIHRLDQKSQVLITNQYLKPKEHSMENLLDLLSETLELKPEYDIYKQGVWLEFQL
jgi:hypothetical protein